MLKWNVTKRDALLIAQIVKRAAKMLGQIDTLKLHMDVSAVHSNGCPLKLREFLDADDGNFGHDVGGISRHIDRETGQLTDGFLPRFAA